MKSIKLNFFYNVLLNMSKVLFPLITAPYVARVLEPEGVGLFNFSNTYAAYFALFAALGIPTYAIREISKRRENIHEQSLFVSEILSLSLFTTLFCSIVFLTSIFFIPQLNSNFLIFLVSGIVLYTTPLKIDWFFSGREEFGYITFRSLVVKTISIILLFVLVHKRSDLFLYVLINVAATIVNEVWNFIKLFQTGIQIKFTLTFKKHLKPLMILFSSAVAVSVYTTLDTIMLGFLREYSEVAYYNSASHISKNLLAISTSLSAVAIPRMAYYMKTESWSEINTLIEKSFSIVSFLAFPITFGIVAIAPTFVPLFYGNQFYGAIIPLQIMIFVVLAIGFNNLTGIQILIGLGHDKLFLYSVLVGTVSNFTLNLLMIPKYGAAGAAFASVVAETLIFFVTFYLAKKYTQVRFSGMKKDFAMSAVCASLFFPIMHFLSNYLNGWILIFVGSSLAGLAYVSLQYLLKNKSVLILREAIISKVRGKLKK